MAAAGEANGGTGKLEFSLDVPFPSSREATIALRSLSPDKEPRKGGISKLITVSGSTLSVRWSADEARILRVSVNSFLDHLSLVLETMEMFGPPVAV
ncbi:EKC/KEOPS complex subunit Lage3 [Neolamprologus brichardi]|uniref:EKC/KEOPS complex subunit Lage3 n=1 Tax=Neolamprologus brichardi TaxID=32507 RepID=UPI001643C500|nr:EKC/KEOPS complex subunit Lage3 [Neolamprologus brichardi]